MDAAPPDRRRTNSNRSEPWSLDRRTSGSSLSRVRSQELAIVESIAVTEDPDEGADSVCEDPPDNASTVDWPRSTRYLLLLCAFLTSLSFGVTQVPLIYVFRLMTCDAYYDEQSRHPGTDLPRTKSLLAGALSISMRTVNEGEPDRCSLHAIESSTALSIALLGASTTVFGIVNLFITSRLIKRIGVKLTLLLQVFFPALRLLVQNIGVEVWGLNGIIIVQCSQIVNILGGPSGYLLALNTFTTEVVEHEERTAALGRLTGSQMFGAALGFLLGGIVADEFGINAPFRLTLALFLVASAYVAIFLPYVPFDKAAAATSFSAPKKKKSGWARYAGPLAVFAPRKFIGPDGVVKMEYGSFLLAWGVFLGILATGYIPTLLQLYSTDVFGFGTKANGWLIFMFSTLRGGFLAFVFPRLISIGRRFVARQPVPGSRSGDMDGENPSERDPLLSSTDQAASAVTADSVSRSFTFDLMYTRFSLLVDGLLTLLCTMVQEGWQMYVVAAALPFGSGTGSAAKGTILHMIGRDAGSGARTDALAGVSLVENMARLSTRFASIGRTELVFVCNAGIALIGFFVLVFARFPPDGSEPFENDDDTDSDS